MESNRVFEIDFSQEVSQNTIFDYAEELGKLPILVLTPFDRKQEEEGCLDYLVVITYNTDGSDALFDYLRNIPDYKEKISMVTEHLYSEWMEICLDED